MDIQSLFSSSSSSYTLNEEFPPGRRIVSYSARPFFPPLHEKGHAAVSFTLQFCYLPFISRLLGNRGRRGTRTRIWRRIRERVGVTRPQPTPTSQKAGGDRLGTQKRKETKTPAIHRTTCYYYVRRRLLGKRGKNRFCAMQRQPRLASCILSALCNSKKGGGRPPSRLSELSLSPIPL